LLSHETAAEVWELDGVPASERIHIVVPASRRLRSVDVVVHRIDVSPRERRYVDGLRVTRPELTLMHLAATLNGEQLESAFECARRQRLVTAASVSDLLERSARRGRNGVGPLRALVTLIGGEPPTESVLEVKVARLLRASGLPKAVRQHAIGRLRVDFAWPLLRVVLECDGYRLHSDCFQRDRSRWSELASQGWRVIVVTWDDVMRRSEFVVTQIRDALAFAA
jgi:very-short-patch-repair endonuclease